ncbi:MAG: hypothetical protein IKF99_03085 [Oscillospiraceae bacterium]|nr:hypothetical protein [Oscillospiraceae bacterium]
MKIMIIEATAEDLRASGSLKDAFNGLLQSLFDGSGQPDLEPEEPKPAPEPKKTDKVDWPKAKALCDAGWSYDKIGGRAGDQRRHGQRAPEGDGEMKFLIFIIGMMIGSAVGVLAAALGEAERREE